MQRTGYFIYIFLFVQLLLPANGEAFLVNEWADTMPLKKPKIASKPEVPTKLWTESFSGMEFIWVKGGCYKAGSPTREKGRDSDEGPVHTACVPSFWMGKHEVTQGQWQTIMQYNPSKYRKGNKYPVERVDFAAVNAITQRLNKLHIGEAKFRLPTEAEWEYVCREGGQRNVFPGRQSLHRISWYRENSRQSPQITGSRLPNRFGIYDIGGNVWEWVQDTYDRNGYRKIKVNNPLYNNENGLSRVIRGGSWKENSSALRCANRGFNKFSNKRDDVGVRLVVIVEKQKIEEEEAPTDINIIPF
ncbi:MAG: formylglycine-generating enzyme family protein [Magnetococcales bacterium]|nr:formylglycine-generating enzyme family protein [Magnetococcales bacterium]